MVLPDGALMGKTSFLFQLELEMGDPKLTYVEQLEKRKEDLTQQIKETEMNFKRGSLKREKFFQEYSRLQEAIEQNKWPSGIEIA